MHLTIRFGLLSLLMFIGNQCLSAEIYKWVDEKGKTHYSDKQPAAVQVVKVDPDINVMDSTEVKSVTMYATSWCGYCRKARQFFKKEGIAFTEYDIEKDSSAKRRYDAFGGQGIPIIFVDETRINGFSEDKLTRLLK